MFNLAVMLREAAATSPEKPVALWAGGRMTYAELDDLSDRVAVALQDRGVEPGERVALQLPNVAPFLVAYFGILKAGGIVVPLNVLLRTPEVAYHLSHSSTRVLITWAGVLDQALPGATQAGVGTVFAVGEIPASAAALPFAHLLAASPAGRPMAATDADDTAVIVYTSGTTGKPKGAELTHFQLYMNADIPGRLFGVRPDDVVLTVLPLFHVFGLSSILNCALRFGACLSLVPRFEPKAVLDAMVRDGATIFEGVPTMFAGLLAYPGLADYDLSRLRIAISGGAPIPASTLDAFEDRFGVVVLEGYGMSETASTATFNHSAQDRRPYSVGKPLWGSECQIWDEHGRRLPRGREHVGEIVTRGPHTMKGYFRDPDATAAAFSDGWLHTEDLGYQDEDGFFFVVDRKKELVIRGGYNVYPREVEEVLYSHPAVAEAAVIGIPDERLGEEVLAFVALRSGAHATEGELIAHCRERLAAYKYPRVIQVRTELPRSGAGKILELALKAELPGAGAARHRDEEPVVRQLTGLDAAFLAMESPQVQGHVGSVCLLDPSTAPEPVTLARFTALIASRMHLVPVFTRRLVTVPWGLDQPYWVQDGEPDLGYHVREIALPAPGDDHQLAVLVARLHARPLDRSRPLWELYLITGLRGGRAAVYTKVHHAAMDGVSGDALLAAVLDPTPQGRPEPAAARVHERAPGSVSLLARSAVSLLRRPARVVRIGAQVLRSTPGLALAAADRVPALDRIHHHDQVAPHPGLRAPHTPFNAAISPQRSWAFADLPMRDVVAVKQAAGVTVNDVVMALCAGALRRWLQAHDALPHDPLVAAVPVSIRAEHPDEPLGNQLSAMLAAVPTDVGTPSGRLAAAAAAMHAAKAEHDALPPTLLADLTDFALPVFANPGWWVAARLRLMERVNPFNLFISNVPGPRVPLYYCGALLLAYYPVSAIAHGQGLNITVMSYRDRLCFGLLACRALVPDVEVLAASLEEELAALLPARGRTTSRPAPG